MDGTVGVVKCPLHIFGVEGKMGLVIIFSLGGMVGILSKNLEGYTTLIIQVGVDHDMLLLIFKIQAHAYFEYGARKMQVLT